jgi:hypothetical protein
MQVMLVFLFFCISFNPGYSFALLHNIVVLQGLDKVTARVHTFEAPVESIIRFGTLEIVARHCDKRPPEETPESAAFLDILEIRQGEPTQSLFRGWMFASSPALSALEHPVYDVWVLGCMGLSDVPKMNQTLPQK